MRILTCAASANHVYVIHHFDSITSAIEFLPYRKKFGLITNQDYHNQKVSMFN